jgi:hypothetical protein
MYLLDGGRRRKSDHFFSNISQTKNSVLGLNRVISLFEASKKRRGKSKSRQNTSIWGKGLKMDKFI